MMKHSNQKAPEIVDGEAFNPADYAGRDVVFVRVPREQGMGREINLAGIRLRAEVDQHPAVIGALAAGTLGWELGTTRMTIGKMLMTDDEFANKTFRGGALADLRERHLDEYTRYASRESKVTQIIPDTINNYRLSFRLADEVAARGVSVREAISHWRWGHYSRVIPAAGAVLWSGYALLSGHHPFAQQSELENNQRHPASLLDADAADWRGKVLGAMNKAAGK